MSIPKIVIELRKKAHPETAKLVSRYFKTGPGQYGEGDVFLGVKVPVIRKLIQTCGIPPVTSIKLMLKSKYHEERLAALLCLVKRFEKEDEQGRRTIFNLYLRSTHYINNWDLVDLSAHEIVGAWLRQNKKDLVILQKLAKSELLWDRRIAIVAPYEFIKHGDFTPTIRIARILLHDDEDLIQKAVGWMLREVGKRDIATERAFLDKHACAMPRTMLRYAIERFSTRERKKYMSMK